jgi:hypothetical protein
MGQLTVFLVILRLPATHHPWVRWQSTAGHILLISTHNPWISWQSNSGHTSVTLHLSPVDQMAEYRWSHFCYSPLITRGSAGRAQLVTFLLLSSHHQCQLAEHTGHTSVAPHSPVITVDQLTEHRWTHCCYSTVITRGSAGRAQLVTLLFLSTQHPCVSWQSTAGHTSVTLHSSPVDQLAEHSWSHFCYSPVITSVSWQSTLVTLRLLPTLQLSPWIS